MRIGYILTDPLDTFMTETTLTVSLSIHFSDRINATQLKSEILYTSPISSNKYFVVLYFEILFTYKHINK